MPSGLDLEAFFPNVLANSFDVFILWSKVGIATGYRLDDLRVRV
jgi:hypothetical protein